MTATATPAHRTRPLLGLRRQPGRIALAFMRLPRPLFHRGWGSLLGHTFLLITHQGRKTGKRRETVAMALMYEPDTKETVVCSAWGPNTEWIRNLRAHPALEIRIGGDRYVPEQRFLAEDEAVAVALEFRSRHPRRLRLFSTILGWGDLGTEPAVRELVRTRPFVSFRPPQEPARYTRSRALAPQVGLLQDGAWMSPLKPDLERARAACAERSWLEASEAFARADEAEPLAPADLELRATTARMLARDDEAVELLERAHHAYLESGETLRAAYCAGWIGMSLFYTGAIGPAGGWLARAHRLLEDVPGETAVHGYALLPTVFRREAAGDSEGAAAAAGEAAAIGKRHRDSELMALAIHAQGHMLVLAGRVPEGLALLDEAMVIATTAEVSPFVVGLVYCGVILACQAGFEVGRAREWTLELTRWVEEQRDLVAFTGRCLVHRAEILQLGGSWLEALEEARLAADRLVETQNPAAGLALYRQGELLRLRGEFGAAEAAYRDASRNGWEPQPGLAQLRLAQGRRDAAVAAIRRACAEAAEPIKRAALLPAWIEIALAGGELEEARTACDELRVLATRYESAMLEAIVAYADGAVAIAEGDAASALATLRRAHRLWLELDAPYEIARTRELIARACSSLGDDEATALELEAARELYERLGAAPDLARVSTGAGAGYGLSRRELEVLRLVAAGKSNREIASALVISEHTVARHLQNIYAKLRVPSRAAATAFAFEHDLV